MEKDEKKLKEIGIVDNGKKKQFCPECHANRTNQRDKSLSVDWDKCIAHCHYCGKSFFFGKTEKIYHATKVVQTPRQEAKGCKKLGKLANEEPLDNNMRRWFEDRGIPVEVAEAEGVFKASRKMPQTGKVESCIVFPYRVEGELVNRKYRDGAKNFMLESGARLVPYRIDKIRDTAECIICEGEMDALSFIVAGYDNVVSVPNGAQKNHRRTLLMNVGTNFGEAARFARDQIDPQSPVVRTPITRTFSGRSPQML